MKSSLKPPIIILDEDQNYLSAASEVLVDMGHQVHATQSPFEAINVIHSLDRSSILLLDYTMTEMRPRQFVKYVHEINRFGFFGILVSENINSDEKRVMCEDALSDGIRMYFDKIRVLPTGESVYALDTLYRRNIMSAEKTLNEFTTLRQDPLTNLPNRLGGLKQWEAVWTQRMMRNKGPLSFVLLDFNGMRITNNTYGHPAGDTLIKKFASKLEEELRIADIVIRWGGDEFLIIMKNTSRQKASFAIKRLKQVFEETQFEVVEGVHIPVLFCAGVATYTGRYVENTAESVFTESVKLADISLYEDKAKKK